MNCEVKFINQPNFRSIVVYLIHLANRTTLSNQDHNTVWEVMQAKFTELCPEAWDVAV